mmetsp:Transcript_8252/g.20274  ORF Transcript_8252/g.20274 Transcript_8252/m.20274 type:complete len:276 (-) Transcript_8252:1636-2463(-)
MCSNEPSLKSLLLSIVRSSTSPSRTCCPADLNFPFTSFVFIQITSPSTVRYLLCPSSCSSSSRAATNACWLCGSQTHSESTTSASPGNQVSILFESMLLADDRRFSSSSSENRKIENRLSLGDVTGGDSVPPSPRSSSVMLEEMFMLDDKDLESFTESNPSPIAVVGASGAVSSVVSVGALLMRRGGGGRIKSPSRSNFEFPKVVILSPMVAPDSCILGSVLLSDGWFAPSSVADTESPFSFSLSFSFATLMVMWEKLGAFNMRVEPRCMDIFSS